MARYLNKVAFCSIFGRGFEEVFWKFILEERIQKTNQDYTEFQILL